MSEVAAHGLHIDVGERGSWCRLGDKGPSFTTDAHAATSILRLSVGSHRRQASLGSRACCAAKLPAVDARASGSQVCIHTYRACMLCIFRFDRSAQTRGDQGMLQRIVQF